MGINTIPVLSGEVKVVVKRSNVSSQMNYILSTRLPLNRTRNDMPNDFINLEELRNNGYDNNFIQSLRGTSFQGPVSLIADTNQAANVLIGGFKLTSAISNPFIETFAGPNYGWDNVVLRTTDGGVGPKPADLMEDYEADSASAVNTAISLQQDFITVPSITTATITAPTIVGGGSITPDDTYDGGDSGR